MSELQNFSNWSLFALSDLADYHNGFAFKPKDWSEDGIKIIRIEQLNNPEGQYDRYEGTFSATNLINDGDLIFSWSATLKVVIWKHGLAVLNQHLFRVDVKQDFDKTYIYYILDYHMDSLANGSHGSTMKHIKRSELKTYKVPIPDIKQQQNIACILQTIDQAIEKTEALIEKYQHIKAGLMHDLFTRGIGADGKLRPPREQAPELYQHTPIGWIPKEWQIFRMVELAENRKGSTTIGPFGSDLVANDYQVEGVPVVFVRDIKASGFEWNSETYVSDKKALQLKAHSIKAGEVLITKMGLPPCISCLFPSWMPNAVMTADIIRLTPDASKIDGYWLTAAINHDRVMRQVAGITAGVTRAKVTLADFRGLRIAIPALSEQQNISEKIRIVQNKINADLAQVDKLQKQKSGLMHDLLTGKVQVKINNTTEAVYG